jgi:hypothetical protein
MDDVAFPSPYHPITTSVASNHPMTLVRLGPERTVLRAAPTRALPGPPMNCLAKQASHVS